MEEIKGYKGYNKDLICRKGQSNEQQYVIGETYEQEEAEACKTGFHFCENPLDIFNYYPPSIARFTEVTGSGKISKEENSSDTKVSVSKLKVGFEVSLQNIIESGIKFIFEHTTLTKECTNTLEKVHASNSGDYGASSNSGTCGASSNSGDYGASSNSGDYGASSNSGTCGASSNSGDYGASSNSGTRGASSNSGYQGASSNSGYQGASSNSGTRGASSNSGTRGASSNSGYQGASSNSGDYGASSNSGTRGASSNSGYQGASSNSGTCGASMSVASESSSETNAKESVAIVTGLDCKVRGNLGSWIVATERNNNWEILSIISKKVDGKKIKADVWYKNVGGQLIEFKD
jgi:hypothetical protein